MKGGSYHNLWGSSKLHFLKTLLNTDRATVVICADSITAEKTVNEATLFFPDKKILYFPEYSQEPFEKIRVLPDITSARVDTLDNLDSSQNCLIVSTPYGLLKKLPSRSVFRSAIKEINIGQELSRDDLLQYFDISGFINVEVVNAPGEFTIRGDKLDVFPINYEYPLRIEFFDNIVECINIYNPETQRTIERISYARVLPATEAITATKVLKAKVSHLRHIHDEIKLFGKFAGFHWYMPAVYDRFNTLFDFIESEYNIVICGDNILDAVKKREESIIHAHKNYEDTLPWESNFLSGNELEDIITKNNPVFLMELDDKSSANVEEYSGIGGITTPDKSNIYKSTDSYCNIFRDYLNKNFTIILAIESIKFRKILEDQLQEYNISPITIRNLSEVTGKGLYFYDAKVTGGFIANRQKIALFSDDDIFGFSKKAYKKKKKLPFDTALSDLEPNDFVVHSDYGIGKFIKLTNKSIGGIKGDFLELEYEKGEILYVPIKFITYVKKYVAKQGHPPKLSSLGSTKWLNLKKRAYSSARKIAFDLLKLYYERKTHKGCSLNPDELMLKNLENSFEYDETEDQVSALYDIMTDMASHKPMERLICGDVGFGKTELAIRAACIAVSSGKQVAVLAPTIVLVHQHYDTFCKRFGELPIKIDYLSRLKPRKEITVTKQNLIEGKIDIIIGTHLLLSKEITFSDLGLLIIDEEQRFGVSDKEKIKVFRGGVDVLALSATPLPRTLQLSLSGLRDISLIQTPPEDRLPVITKIIKSGAELVAAIRRELETGGQVFFLHNKISDIERITMDLKEKLGSAVVEFVHGRMKPEHLEKKINNFYSGDIDVLVSTSIIENGVDVPNANTIIIDNAHHIGLADLYQLKGRVGRSKKRGYCYLMINDINKLSEIAQKRLRIIQQLSDLGSGFKISTYDLQLRGAGDILGARQSGFITGIGYDLYIEMISSALRSLKGKEPISLKTELLSDIPYFIPAEYIYDPAIRIKYYRKASQIESLSEIKEMESELSGEYGDLPPEVTNLLYLLCIRNLASKSNIKKIVSSGDNFVLTFSKETDTDLKQIVWAAKKTSLTARFKNEFELNLTQNSSNLLENVLFFLSLTHEWQDYQIVKNGTQS